MKTPRTDIEELKSISHGGLDEKRVMRAYDLARQLEREIQTLADLIWTTRWASDDDHYQKMVGIAAEIRSGNYETITGLTKAE